MEASNLLSTWKKSVKAVLRKFNILHYALPGGKLSKLPHSGSVIDYEIEFEEMCTKVLGSSDYFVLEMFIYGLKEDIQKEVIKGKLVDLQESFVGGREFITY